jgi:ATP-binding cassette, subfamily B, bacterial
MGRPDSADPRKALVQAWPGLRRTVSRFRGHIKAERKLLALGTLAMLAEAALQLLEPWPLAYVLDAIIDRQDLTLGGLPGLGDIPALVVVCALAVIGVVTLRALTAYLTTICFALAGNRVLTRVRAEVYAHLNALSLRFHDRRGTGDLVTRVTGDVGRLQDALVTAITPLLGNVLTLVAMFVVVAFADWQLALVVVLVLPLFGLTSRRLTTRISEVSRTQRTAEGAIASLATETLSSMAVVQSYSLEERMQERFASSNKRSLKDGVKGKKLSAALERKTDVLVGLGTALVLAVGAWRVLGGHLSIGELTVFLAYLKTAFKPLRDVAKYTGRIAKAAASGERIVDVLDEEIEITDAPYARPAARFAGAVEFCDVEMAYRPGHPVLRGLSFQVRAGERVAVVGPSGAGKSSLVSLLCRLHNPDAGQVRIDGQPLANLTVRSVRAQIAIVLQESVLFAMSIRDNIALGAPGPVSHEEIVAAARLAGAHEFITALPQGYDTVVGERGSTLSGGERQRIAIARAAVRNAPIVILDEAMTGLDAATETEVAAALARLTAGRTTFVITHDLEAARDCDRVIWVERGRARRIGTPEEILGQPARLVVAPDPIAAVSPAPRRAALVS